MKRVLVLVEGQTEERFVKDVLAPHLWARGKDPIPKVVTTKRVKRGPDFKGGITDYQKVESDLRRLLGDTGVVAVTTFIDYYALPVDFPGMGTRPNSIPQDRAKHVENEWKQSIDHSRFRPFLMIHEFEALLFAKPDELSKALYQNEALQELTAIRASFVTPEDINDHPLTAPSKRIMRIMPGYQKTLHGPLVTKRIGLEILCGECPHFRDWIGWMESL
ncbi:DUF4276 family protein [Geobacter pickeringii]|uniref:DUF4276 family protein n=1 Tax=Geobacter pickeringii TaxID=345632 RepID=A0A0B5BBQ5_9BACT|nr:DUF4276 family protein [Geobacter pickeringii]AJE02429.1 hypothetical protein GPICK_02690 [Geobacter pickeringii]